MGTTSAFESPARVFDGSPPRAWGQRANSSSIRSTASVHPHARGDNEAFIAQPFASFRFTPTRVGTTRVGAARRADYPVHPHARGDNADRVMKFNDATGSPPRAWGQLLTDAQYVAQLTVHPHARGDNEAALYQLRERLRFTPTRVGTTLKFLLLFLDANQQ